MTSILIIVSASHISCRLLRLPGREVGGDRHHIVVSEPRHDVAHQRFRWPGAAAVLEKIKLADDVASMPPDDRRRGAEASQVRAMANGAGGRFAAAGSDQHLAFGN